jgi:RND superfamily putative drug exporter
VLACALALASSMVAIPAALGLWLRWGRDAAAEPAGSARIAEASRAAAGFLAGSRARTVVAAVLAAVAMIAAAAPILHADSRPLSAVDLPAGSAPREAARVLSPSRIEPAEAGSRDFVEDPASSLTDRDSLFGRLVLAAAVSAGALLLVFAIGFRSARLIPMAVVALLPAAAACGLCVLVFQDGHIAELFGQRRPGALETGTVASLLAALVAVSAIRGIAAVQAVREERLLGLEPVPSAGTAAALTVPAAVAAGVIGAAMAGVLVGVDLAPAREFGLAIAAGLLLDLVLLRLPIVAALARWGVSSQQATHDVAGVGQSSTV